MVTNVEPRLAPGRTPGTPTVVQAQAAQTRPAPTLSAAQTSELEVLTMLGISSCVLGLGAALIDSTYATAAHPPTYYWGWVLLALGFVLVVRTFALNLSDRVWAPLLLLAVGVYGWWNAVWTVLTVWYGGQISSAGGEVILANFGSAWPYDHGLVEAPLWVFLGSTVFAILLPAAVYSVRRRRFVQG